MLDIPSDVRCDLQCDVQYDIQCDVQFAIQHDMQCDLQSGKQRDLQCVTCNVICGLTYIVFIYDIYIYIYYGHI